jgi:Protein of unknown function (DUF1236)
MRRACYLLLAATAIGWSIGQATAQPTLGTPVETEPVQLPPDKQALIRDHVRRSNLPADELGAPVAVGMTVPPSVELLALPQDSATEVPTVTSYRFLIAGDVIAVVEPETRKVIQLIRR